MVFVDITAIPVASDGRAAYTDFSRRMAEVYLDHGAIRVTDHWQAPDPVDQGDFHADGATYEPGELRDFPAVMGSSASEAIVVSITEWPSRAARDAGVTAATSDARVTATLDETPVFDGSRVVASSFETTMDVRR